MLQVEKHHRFHGEFYAEKYSKVFLWNVWNVLTRMRRRKKKEKNDAFCTSGVGPF